MNLRRVLWSWDSGAAVLIMGITLALLHDGIAGASARDVYGVGVSVLSTTFAVFFAALAVMLSSSDDEFVLFMEEEDHYSGLVRSFGFTLKALFATLCLSLVAYVRADICLERSQRFCESGWVFSIYSAAVAYSLVAVFQTSLDALRYSQYRVSFLQRSSSRPPR